MNYTYTKEQDDWLRENWKERGGKCVPMFNDKFGQKRTYQMIRSHCQNVLKVRVSKELQSEKCRRNAKRYVPIGTTRKVKGYWRIKVADEYGKKSTNWMLLHHYNYIKANGDIPKNTVVIFLDGNHDNCEAENLVAIPQGVNALLMTKKLRSIGRTVTRTSVEWCKLYMMLQEDGYFERERERELEKKKAKRYADLNANMKRAVYKCDADGNVLKRYSGVAEAARAEGVSASHISACARNKRHTCGGYKWKYED